MKIVKFKTTIQTEEEANTLLAILKPLFPDGYLHINLFHPDKILTIESTCEENHFEIARDIIKACRIKLQDILPQRKTQ
ncbi:MAG TPA: hypothetical protein VE978_03955 [Chitinophagales bacterium]|nr:hypothetical protein [Chitinophagales bacterium]